jgi:hypothetical protein
MSDTKTTPPLSNWERIRALKETADLRQVAARLGLRQEGKHYFCPKCQVSDNAEPDQKPELVILDRVFLCDRCGTGGDALTLIRLVRGGGLQGTIEYLEQLIQSPDTLPSSIPSPLSESRWKPSTRKIDSPPLATKQPDAKIEIPKHPSAPRSQSVPKKETSDAAPPSPSPQKPSTVSSSGPGTETEPLTSLFSNHFLSALGDFPPSEQQKKTVQNLEISDGKDSLSPAQSQQPEGASPVADLNEAEEKSGEAPEKLSIPPSPERRSEVYEAFLSACWPLESARFVVSWLEERGLSVETANRLGIRLCGASYADLMERLEKEWGTETLIDAGLLTENPEQTGYLPAFWPYFKHSVAFLVVPYFREGKPVYLKALPPIDRKRAEELYLPPMISLRIPFPCLYNQDALAGVQGGRILFCERETDVLSAESNGFAAVGIPGWAHFKPDWVHFFEEIEVFLVLDDDEVALDGTRRIARFFQEAGMPQPKEIRLPAGCDLKDYLSA